MTPIVDRGEYRSAAAEAETLTKGARNGAYGHPLDDYTKTGALIAPILWEGWVKPMLAARGVELSVAVPKPVPAEVAIMCMIQVKISRELNSPQFDNRADMCGYAECLNMARHERDRRLAEDGEG